MRKSVKDENPDFEATDILKELGARWRSLSSDEKEPYETKAKSLKAEYNEKLRLYKAGKGDTEVDAEDVHDAAMDEDWVKNKTFIYRHFCNKILIII